MRQGNDLTPWAAGQRMDWTGRGLRRSSGEAGLPRGMSTSQPLVPVTVTTLGKRVFAGSQDEMVLDYADGS